MKEVNPLKRIRLAANLTMVDVAEQAGVSRQFVIRAEQGVFATLPTAVANALMDLTDQVEDITVLEAMYGDWQRLRREESMGVLIQGFDFHTHSETPGLQHPFTHWRLHSDIKARIAISKLFCVHPALVFKFEEQPWLCTTPPGELIAGLGQAGYTKEITLLELAYAEFRKARRDKA